MKKFILSSFSMLVLTAAYSQFEKSNIVLGGNASFFSNQQQSNTLSLAPELSYALSENSVFGLFTSYQNSAVETGSFTGSTTKLSIGLGYRKYYELPNNLYFNWQIGGNYSYNKTDFRPINATQSDKSSTSSLGAALSPGFAWKPVNWLLLEARFGSISYVTNLTNGNTNFSTFNISLNSLSFGFNFILK